MAFGYFFIACTVALKVGGTLRMTKFGTIWQPLVRHRSLLIGALLIGAVWITLSLFLTNERASAERAAIQNSTNLAGSFESHFSNSLGEIDSSLKLAGALYAQRPDRFDLVAWLKTGDLFPDGVTRVSLVNRDGIVEQSSMATAPGTSVADRPYFRSQLTAKASELFIGMPTTPEEDGVWSIALSRRLLTPDGQFNGVIAASIDSSVFTRIYNSVNIGRQGYIRIIGLDGIVRATSGQVDFILGKDFSTSNLFRRLSADPTGWFYTKSNFSDKVPRLIAYRVVRDYPFVISVGLATSEIFSRVEAKKRSGYVIAGFLTLLIGAATALSIRGQWLREAAKKHLERANMLLNEALANMPHGICMFGPDKKLVLANDLYSTMYGIEAGRIRPGMALSEILDLRVAAGCCPADAQKYIQDRMHEAFLPDPGYIINKLQDGRTYAVAPCPVAARLPFTRTSPLI
jgi:two-component system, sensor histidine kinase